MDAILSASVGQEQLLTELLVTYAKVSSLRVVVIPVPGLQLELGSSGGQCAILG